MTTRDRLLVLAVVVALPLAACSRGSSTAAPTGTRTSSSASTQVSSAPGSATPSPTTPRPSTSPSASVYGPTAAASAKASPAYSGLPSASSTIVVGGPDTTKNSPKATNAVTVTLAPNP